ncbi:MAG: hypothetical protein WAM14_15765 [Candidatus Nitrosopolaris sp.]
MNLKIWFQKKIKKQLTSAKVKKIATPKAKRDDESKEESHLESNLQSSEQLVAEEQAATPKKTEPIQDIPVEENQIPSATTSRHDNINDNIDDYILNVLHDLPEQWVGKEMKLHVIADRRDATWITKRVFQDVERGLITARFTVKESNHMCDITFILKIADGLASFPSAITAINPVFSYILTDIKSESISRRKRKAFAY